MNPEFSRLAAARNIMLPAVTAERTLIQERMDAERWIKAFSPPHPNEADGLIEGCRVVRPSVEPDDNTRIFYIHGGGLVYYSTDVFHPLLAFWANHCAATIEAFEYPKAPETSTSHIVDELASAMEKRLDGGGRVVLAGDSVGGLLALYLCTRLFPRRFSGLTLIYPVLDLHRERASYGKFGSGYFLDAILMRKFRQFMSPYFAERNFNPFSLSQEEKFSLPLCTVFTAGYDVLSDEGVAWVADMLASGIAMRHRHFSDLPHDFCLYFGKLQSSRQAVEEIALSLLE